MIRISGAILATVVAGACKAATPLVGCPMNIVAIPLIVVTTDGSPVPGLTISDTILRMGQVFTFPSPAAVVSRTRVIFADSLIGFIRPQGDSVRVVGTNGTVGFSANFVFDAPGDCHVHKAAGPDSVTVS